MTGSIPAHAPSENWDDDFEFHVKTTTTATNTTSTTTKTTTTMKQTTEMHTLDLDDTHRMSIASSDWDHDLDDDQHHQHQNTSLATTLHVLEDRKNTMYISPEWIEPPPPPPPPAHPLAPGPGPSTPRRSAHHRALSRSTENWDDDFEDSPVRKGFPSPPGKEKTSPSRNRRVHATPQRERRERARETQHQPRPESWDDEFDGVAPTTAPAEGAYSDSEDEERHPRDGDGDADDFGYAARDEEDRTVTARSRRAALRRLSSPPPGEGGTPPPPVPAVPLPFLLPSSSTSSKNPRNTSPSPFPRSPTSSVFSVPTTVGGRPPSTAYTVTSTTHLRPTTSRSSSPHGGRGFAGLPPSPPIHRERERRRLRKKSRPPVAGAGAAIELRERVREREREREASDGYEYSYPYDTPEEPSDADASRPRTPPPETTNVPATPSSGGGGGGGAGALLSISSAKKEQCIENVKVTNSAWDTNFISASGAYLSINWNASGGGAFAILPLPSPFHAIPGFPHKLPDTLPLTRSHTAAALDTDWSPHNDAIVASGGEDGKVMIWKVEASAFEGWGSEGWVPQDFDPVARIDGSPRKIGQVLFHPTASNVLASASGEHTIKLWDLANTEEARSVLVGHGDAIQSMAFNPTGTLLATTCRDRKLRLFDPRTGGEAVRVVDGHGGIKGSRVAWMADLDKIATTGFSKMSDRQVAIWETGGLGNVKTIVLDQSAGVVMPFWTDNNILFLAGKGDGNIRYYEYESDTLHALSEHKSSDPQRGMCFLPRRALNVGECEIARAYKFRGSSVEPIAFIVPRKADSFQSDIFPPAASAEPSLSASEFFAGKSAPRNLVDLSSGASFAGTAVPTPTFTSPPAISAPAPAPALARPNSYSAPKQEPTPAPSPVVVQQQQPTPSPAASPVVEPHAMARAQTLGADAPSSAVLRDENARLAAELREAREKIRNLELQVESMRANARKAAQQLLEG
ncbi:putative WD repeat coronin family protein [Lyophyllum shimeji]|uniref:Coronin n=1 Tax=Lyophyllum shimeji TaxID=47721 RepID=A0A9P3URK8_LYOSH|nr:putative WD repeat coronin family protein [Lyophyllum shimeji]